VHHGDESPYYEPHVFDVAKAAGCAAFSYPEIEDVHDIRCRKKPPSPMFLLTRFVHLYP